MKIQHTNFGSISVIRCGIHEGKYDYDTHIHQFCELVWVLDGEIEMTVDGKTEVARASDITVIAPFQAHSFYTPKGCRIWICVISDDLLSAIPRDELYCPRSKAVFTPSAELDGYLRGCDFPELCLQFARMSQDSRYLHRIKSVFYLILSEYFSKTSALARAVGGDTLSKILIYISENFRDDINQGAVGKALGYSPRYISNCFKALPGINFRTMLNSMRIECAKGLLINTDKNITEIAMDAGFAGERSFHRAFLGIAGITPGEYRRRKRLG